MRISFGNNLREGAVVLDLEREDIHFVLLAGKVGAGKSFFHRHVYHDLVTEHLPSTLKFLFLDPAGADTRGWSHSPYLLVPPSSDPEETLRELERLAQKSEERTFAGAGGTQHTIVHIEGSALVRHDRERLERCFDRLLAHRKTNQVYIFYSTSVVDREILTSWLSKYVDLRVIFDLGNERDARYLAGGPLRFFEPGEHVVVWKGRHFHCLPFNQE